MTSCVTSTAHRYDPNIDLMGNILGGPQPEGLSSIFWCSSSFIESTDLSTMTLLCGAVFGTVFWYRAPRVSGALLAGSVVFWAWYQFASFRFQTMLNVNLQEKSLDIIYPQGRFYQAFWHQVIFELLFFLLLPVAVAIVWRRKEKKNLIADIARQGATA